MLLREIYIYICVCIDVASKKKRVDSDVTCDGLKPGDKQQASVTDCVTSHMTWLRVFGITVTRAGCLCPRHVPKIVY